MTKYYAQAQRTEDGYFASKKELARWEELKLLQRGKVISELKRQVRYPLAVNGVKICTYVADHVYLEGEAKIVEDVKSKFTKTMPMYKMKKALLKAIYGIEIRET